MYLTCVSPNFTAIYEIWEYKGVVPYIYFTLCLLAHFPALYIIPIACDIFYFNIDNMLMLIQFIVDKDP